MDRCALAGWSPVRPTCPVPDHSGICCAPTPLQVAASPSAGPSIAYPPSPSGPPSGSSRRAGGRPQPGRTASGATTRPSRRELAAQAFTAGGGEFDRERAIVEGRRGGRLGGGGEGDGGEGRSAEEIALAKVVDKEYAGKRESRDSFRAWERFSETALSSMLTQVGGSSLDSQSRSVLAASLRDASGQSGSRWRSWHRALRERLRADCSDCHTSHGGTFSCDGIWRTARLSLHGERSSCAHFGTFCSRVNLLNAPASAHLLLIPPPGSIVRVSALDSAMYRNLQLPPACCLVPARS